ncbi:MAG: polysaccharide biosynthesis/export family protein [Bryobacteraceae bacterium]
MGMKRLVRRTPGSGRRAVCAVFLAAGLAAAAAGSPAAGPPADERGRSGSASEGYVLGPEDQVKIWALGVEEIPDRPFRIDADGGIDLPLVGRVEAVGLTLDQLREVLLKRLASQVWRPQVSVELVEFGSQPVTVLGAVGNPGIHQLQGRRNLAEMLSLAGGLRQDAGYSVKITRLRKFGTVPLASAQWDPTGEYSVGEMAVRDLLNANNPAQNVTIQPYDVITVPTAEKIYVIGTVNKAGAIVLNDRESISVLQAISMAEGLARTAKPESSKILRMPDGGAERAELPVDVKRILAGRAVDVQLQANDVLFVPDSTSRRVAVRTLEAMLQAATGVVIFRR